MSGARNKAKGALKYFENLLETLESGDIERYKEYLRRRIEKAKEKVALREANIVANGGSVKDSA